MNEFKFGFGEYVQHKLGGSVMMVIGRAHNRININDTTSPDIDRYRCRFFGNDKYYDKWFHEFELKGGENK